MNLYYAASLYHILCFSLHAMIFQPGVRCHLVVSDNIFSKSGMAELERQLKDSGIFTQVTIMAFTGGEFFNEYTLEEGCSKETIWHFLESSSAQVERWLEEHQICLDDYENKYTAIDHRLLGLYWLYKKYPYYYFEDGNGLLSRSQSQLELHKQLQYETYSIVTTLHGFGENDLVIKKYANMNAQLPGFSDPKAVDFDTISLFASLDKEQKKKIFTMYGLNGDLLSSGEKTFLFLTRFAKYLKKPNVYHHMYLNGALLDLFAKGHRIIVKPHPRDYSGAYSLNWPDCEVLPKSFPSELLPFLQENDYDRIMTIGSTAIDALSDFGDCILKFDREMEDKADYIFTYYMAVRILLHLFPKIGPEDVALFGCSLELMNPLFLIYGGFKPIPPKQFVNQIAIVDRQFPGFRPEADVTIYLHTDNRFQFYREDPDCFSRLIYMDLSLTPRSGSFLTKKKEHYLLIDVKDPSLRKKIASYCYREMLPHTKADLNAGTFSLLQRKCLLARLHLKALRTIKNPLFKQSPLFLSPGKEYYNEDTLFLLNCEIRKEMEEERL
ncbi:MAG: hypothetical protein Q4B70_02585 [Lachnospiraceae bacterium]|nr:hypothetical protein [Lachnospiraceae bacterium]